jgi:glyoxylase I family protein
MPRSLAFYRDLLGFEIVQQAPVGDNCGWAWLKVDGAELMLNTMHEASDRPAAPDPARMAAHGDTGLFIGETDVEAIYFYPQSKGVSVSKPAVRGYGIMRTYLPDPDGYSICLQCPAA